MDPLQRAHFHPMSGIFHGDVWKSDAMKFCRHRAHKDLHWLSTRGVFQDSWPPNIFSKPLLIELVLKICEEDHMMKKEGELSSSGYPRCHRRTVD